MDRLETFSFFHAFVSVSYLHSSMDRLETLNRPPRFPCHTNLHSSMDRLETKNNIDSSDDTKKFTFQYG